MGFEVCIFIVNHSQTQEIFTLNTRLYCQICCLGEIKKTIFIHIFSLKTQLQAFSRSQYFLYFSKGEK